MLGFPSDVNSLGERKRQLIAESELHRAELCEACRLVASEARAMAGQASALGTAAAAAARLLAGWMMRHRTPRPTPAPRTWFERLLNAADVAATIWSAMRPGERKASPR